MKTTTENKRLIDVKALPLADQRIHGVVKRLIRRTPIPGPDDPLYSDTYKVLVDQFSQCFIDQAQTDSLEAEVTARKLAAWVMTYKEKHKNYKKGDSSKSIVHSNAPGHKSEPASVKLYNVTTQITVPYWETPGEVIKLRDKQGKYFVKGIGTGSNKKTLIKKMKKTIDGSEVSSSWLIEVADKSTVGSKTDQPSSIVSSSLKTSSSMSLRAPVTVDEWKTIADIKKNEAKEWKKQYCTKNNEPSKYSIPSADSGDNSTVYTAGSTSSMGQSNTNVSNSVKKEIFSVDSSDQLVYKGMSKFQVADPRTNWKNF